MGKKGRSTKRAPDVIAPRVPISITGILSLVWVVGFVIVFSTFSLPNNPEVSRLDIWGQLPDLIFSWLPIGGDANSGLHTFTERIWPLFLVSTMVASSWSLGTLLLYAFGVSKQITRCERVAIAGGLGIAGWSLITLLLGYAGLLNRTAFIIPMVLCVGTHLLIRLRSVYRTPGGIVPGDRLTWIVVASVSPFMLLMLLGSMLPSIDFDVKAYHLTGPKEWFLDGHISWLPHNVYTSFPFLTEMMTLWGMVLDGDWYTGAIVGKGMLMMFTPLCSLAIYALARRCFSHEAGIFAVLIHMTTPWVYRISIIAYAEGGVSLYLILTLLAAVITRETLPSRRRTSFLIVTGILAGSAMACKYPGVVSVIIPVGLWLLIEPRATWLKNSRDETTTRPSRWRTGLFFSVGVLIAIGPWLIKNALETGNPLYPLVWSVFGGADWDAVMNAKWKAGHSPDGHSPLDLLVKLSDVTLRSDWLSPLLYAFAPLSLLLWKSAPKVKRTWIFLGWSFLTWWVLTHRIDRFWVPMIPAVCLMSGVGMAWLMDPEHRSVPVRLGGLVVIIASVLFNLGFVSTALCGFNGYWMSMDKARSTAVSTAGAVAFMNQVLPPDARVLAVGEVQVFEAERSIVYNSVFDRVIFEEWTACPDSEPHDPDRSMADSSAVASKLQLEGITHVLVNWQEILRYRNTYGFTDYVTSQKLRRLVRDDVLDVPVSGAEIPWKNLSDQDRKQIESWNPDLPYDRLGEKVIPAWQIWPVIKTDQTTNKAMGGESS